MRVSIPSPRWAVSLAALALLLGVAGCGTRRYPVSGRVTFPDGTPLTAGKVVFEGEVGGKTVMARGAIQPDGSYQLFVSEPGDGVPAGKYRALVLSPEPDVDAKPSPPIDKRFTSLKTSGLEFEVKPGVNEFPIQVTKPGAKPR